MIQAEPPYFIIASRRWFRWYPCLEFTNDGEREIFQSIAGRLVSEFQGHVVERYGGSGPADKEYWWIEFESKRQLLMRKDGVGLVGSDCSDINLFVRIAHSFNARFVGWRWKLWRSMRRP